MLKKSSAFAVKVVNKKTEEIRMNIFSYYTKNLIIETIGPSTKNQEAEIVNLLWLIKTVIIP